MMNLNEIINNLSICFEKVINYEIISTAWNSNNRNNPLIFSTDSGKFVYHYAETTKNLKHYKSVLDKKNDAQIISSPIIKIFEDGFITSYIPGKTLSKMRIPPIKSLAKLQAKFNDSNNLTLDFWLEKMDKIKHVLINNRLIKNNQIPCLEFTKYGLLHGDFSFSNIITAGKKLVIIDLEHVMDGPLAFDLARPLLKMCETSEAKEVYLAEYMKNKIILDKEEIKLGLGIFYLNQAYFRHSWGYPKETKISISKFIKLFKEDYND